MIFYFFLMIQNYTMSSNSEPSSDQQNNQDDNVPLWRYVTITLGILIYVLLYSCKDFWGANATYAL